jgi:hypothetical protein
MEKEYQKMEFMQQKKCRLNSLRRLKMGNLSNNKSDLASTNVDLTKETGSCSTHTAPGAIRSPISLANGWVCLICFLDSPSLIKHGRKIPRLYRCSSIFPLNHQFPADFQEPLEITATTATAEVTEAQDRCMLKFGNHYGTIWQCVKTLYPW